MTYNAANQVTAVTAEGDTATYAYDAAQRLNQITYPSAEVVKYGFNSRGLLESIKSGSNAAIADYTFDDAGRLTKKSLPNGLECVYEYNDANWVTKITLRQTANPSTVLQSFQYGYNKVGNRTWVAYADGSGDVYQYDGTDQLIGVKYGVSNPQDGYAAAIGENRSVSYTYDALGNRVVMLDNATTTNYTVNNLNQYTQIDLNPYTYDTNGNLTGDGTWMFGYDPEGHLISASKNGTNASYKYDALGRRIEKNVNGTVTKYVYSGRDLIEERDGAGNVTAKYVYAGGIDHPVKAIKGANTYYFQQDALGNVTALTDGTGAIVESYTYDAFGKPKIKDGSGNIIGTSTTPFLFTGREYDAETGLYHYRTRAYSPEFGRFLQMDSIGFRGKDWNLYRYVGNNPVNLWDSLGLKEELNFYPPGSSKEKTANSAPNTPDTFDVAGEGTQNGPIDANGNLISPERMLQEMKNAGWDGKKPVQFKQCLSGWAPPGGKSFAEKFHDLTGAPTTGQNGYHNYSYRDFFGNRFWVQDEISGSSPNGPTVPNPGTPTFGK